MPQMAETNTACLEMCVEHPAAKRRLLDPPACPLIRPEIINGYSWVGLWVDLALNIIKVRPLNPPTGPPANRSAALSIHLVLT